MFVKYKHSFHVQTQTQTTPVQSVQFTIHPSLSALSTNTHLCKQFKCNIVYYTKLHFHKITGLHSLCAAYLHAYSLASSVQFYLEIFQFLQNHFHTITLFSPTAILTLLCSPITYYCALFSYSKTFLSSFSSRKKNWNAHYSHHQNIIIIITNTSTIYIFIFAV